MIDMKKDNFCEILSPVGNPDMLIAAIRSGADAVYLGAKLFSARRNAENFTEKELEDAVKYCHIRGVKVYLTLNILIKNHELQDAFNLAQTAYNLGIDGIIIQDLGLASILKEKIPDLPLHASTQLTVHSPAALDFLKEKGFSRVVVSREMSKSELSDFCRKAKEKEIEVEVFVHGALCMSMSGQCLLSAFLGSRSGNRGLCAGPCRLPFKAPGGTGYDLSLKDLSLLEYLSELKEMGVSSFKIEGRMKRPEYVAAATAACRQALDKGCIDEALGETLKNVFSRQGFTDGYYTKKTGISMFGTRTKEDVISADKAFPLIHELYRGELQKIKISLKAEIVQNKPISLTLSDGENTATVKGSIPQKAEKRPISYDDCYKNLSKFGATPYIDIGGGIKLDDGLFVSAKELNSLRREAVEKLDVMRSKNARTKSCENYILKNSVRERKEIKLIARFENAAQIPERLDGIYAIMLPLEENPNIDIPNNVIKIVDIPRGIINEEIIAERLKVFAQKGFRFAACGNLAAVSIAKNCGFRIIGDSGLNISNTETLNSLENYGISSAVLSPELTLNEAEKITGNIPTGLIVYGHLPLMLFRNCPIKNGKDCKDCKKDNYITDRMGIKFPVRCRMGYSEMLNSVPIWLADRKKEINQDFGVLYFTNETKEDIKEIIDGYINELPPMLKHTRGLYYRGTE